MTPDAHHSPIALDVNEFDANDEACMGPDGIGAARTSLVHGLLGAERFLPSTKRAIERFVGCLQPSALQVVASEAAAFDPEHWDLAGELVATHLMTKDGCPQIAGHSIDDMVRGFSILRIAFSYKGLSGSQSNSIVRRVAIIELSDTMNRFAVGDRGNTLGGVRGRFLMKALSLRGLSEDDVQFLHDHGHALYAHRETVFRDHRFDRAWAEGFIAVQPALRDGAL